VIRIEAGMPTTRFCSLIGVPERTWRRHQARARTGLPAKGPWPHPARDRIRDAALGHALAHPAWGHRKVWAMCRHDGLPVSAATVLRLLREDGLLLEADYQRERRQLAAPRKAAFAVEPTARNQVWQLDFTEFETTSGGTWRLAGCRDYWSKYELGWDVSPTGNQHDAISAIELALTEAERLAGRPLRELEQPGLCGPAGAREPRRSVGSEAIHAIGEPPQSFDADVQHALPPFSRYRRSGGGAILPESSGGGLRAQVAPCAPPSRRHRDGRAGRRRGL
jgi:hypothetical protein